MKRKKRGKIWIILGIILIAAALGLTFYNMWDSWRAGKESDEITRQLEDSTDTSDDADETQNWDPDTPMPVETIDGYDYIGTIEVPSENIKLPVMDRWDYVRLKVSPCRYSGSYYADDLVICGHNYASHFSPIKWVDIGADVYFTSVTGLRIHYVVSNVETLQPTSIEQMVENENNSTEETQEDWDLTLFTCNTGGQTRCAVRCLRVGKSS